MVRTTQSYHARVRGICDRIGERLGITTQEQWYQVKRDAVKNDIPPAVFTRFGRSLFGILKYAYPEFTWNGWMMNENIRSFWTDTSNQQQFRIWFEQQMNINSQEDWYKVTAEDFKRHGAVQLLWRYSYSLVKTITALLPDHKWNLWQFSTPSPGFWMDPKTQRAWMDWYADSRGMESLTEFYKLRASHFREAGAYGLLSHFKLSIVNMFESIYPECNWNIALFHESKTRGFWNSIYNQKKFIQHIKWQFNIEDPEDWYRLTSNDVIRRGGRGLLLKYSGLLSEVLNGVYKTDFWRPWLFPTVPTRYFKNKKNLLEYVEWIEKQLGIKKKEDWYDVSIKQLLKVGGYRGLMRSKLGGLPEVLTTVYPEFPWEPQKFAKLSSHKSQSLIFRTIQQLLPDKTHIEYNYVHPQLRYANGQNMELDVFVPAYALAFEYQGEQHYHELSHFMSGDVIQEKDTQKRKLCRNIGITLIEVPYWWDCKKSSLAATIHLDRPDIVPDPGDGVPIPKHEPNGLPTVGNVWDAVAVESLWTANQPVHSWSMIHRPSALKVWEHEECSMNVSRMQIQCYQSTTKCSKVERMNLLNRSFDEIAERRTKRPKLDSGDLATQLDKELEQYHAAVERLRTSQEASTSSEAISSDNETKKVSETAASPEEEVAFAKCKNWVLKSSAHIPKTKDKARNALQKLCLVRVQVDLELVVYRLLSIGVIVVDEAKKVQKVPSFQIDYNMNQLIEKTNALNVAIAKVSKWIQEQKELCCAVDVFRKRIRQLADVRIQISPDIILDRLVAEGYLKYDS